MADHSADHWAAQLQIIANAFVKGYGDAVKADAPLLVLPPGVESQHLMSFEALAALDLVTKRADAALRELAPGSHARAELATALTVLGWHRSQHTNHYVMRVSKT